MRSTVVLGALKALRREVTACVDFNSTVVDVLTMVCSPFGVDFNRPTADVATPVAGDASLHLLPTPRRRGDASHGQLSFTTNYLQPSFLSYHGGRHPEIMWRYSQRWLINNGKFVSNFRLQPRRTHVEILRDNRRRRVDADVRHGLVFGRGLDC
jgi:hypothetical protein